MKRLQKRLAWLIVALTGVAALVFLLRPKPLAVETAVAVRGAMRVTVDEEGQTRVRDRYVVAAPVAGRMERITLQEGDSVPAEAVVARLYPAPLDARAREQAVGRVSQAEDAERAARASVAQARAAYEQAQRNCARAQELGAKGLISPEERERAELEEATRQRELESADFRAQAAQHDVEVARAALLGDGVRPLVLRSPVGGRVLRIPERSERVVAAGEPLLELGDPSRIEVVADLLSSEAVKVREGNTLFIEGWGGGDTLPGRLRRIEPSGFTKVSALGVEEQRVNIVGDLAAPPRELGDRYRVEIHVVVWESPSVLRVPANAVFRLGEGWAVFVMEAGRARLRQVQVGHRTPFENEITGGVAAGAILIRSPSDRIHDGVRVSARRTGN